MSGNVIDHQANIVGKGTNADVAILGDAVEFPQEDVNHQNEE